MPQTIKTLTFLLLTFLYIPATVWGQQTKTLYAPVLWDKCEQKLDTLFASWSIRNLASPDKRYFDFNTTSVTVSADSAYLLRVWSLEAQDSILIPKNYFPKKADTVYKRQLIAQHPFEPHTFGTCPYAFCYKPANGKIVDYYRPGKKRMEGTFENEALKDTLKHYYPTGLLFRLITFQENGEEVQIEYYPSGLTKSYYIPHREKLLFHENGNLKSYQEGKKRIKITYYPSGKLKSAQKKRSIESYYETGELLAKSTKRKRKNFSKDGALLSIVKRIEVQKFKRIKKSGARRRFLKEQQKYLNDYLISHKWNGRDYYYEWAFYDGKEKALEIDFFGFDDEENLYNPFPEVLDVIPHIARKKVKSYFQQRATKKESAKGKVK